MSARTQGYTVRGDAFEQAFLAAEDLLTAGDVDEQAIGRIGCDHWRPSQSPVRQAMQRAEIACGIIIFNPAVFIDDERAGMGEGHAGDNAAAARTRTALTDDLHAVVEGDQEKRWCGK